MRGFKLLALLLLAGVVALAACDKKAEGDKKEPAAGTTEPGKEAKAEPGKEAKAEPGKPAVDEPTMKLLDAIIAAHGGLDKLKSAATFTAKTKGTYMKMPYTSTSMYKPGAWYMDIAMPGGEKMEMAQGDGICWSKTGPVVMACSKIEAEQSMVEGAFMMASMLWPLKDQDKFKVTAGEGKIGDKAVDTLKIWVKGYEAPGVLSFDKESHFLLQMGHQGKMMGKVDGEFVTTFSDYKEMEGMKHWTKSVTTFAGKPYMDEEYLEVKPGPVDDKLFAQPAQVADLTVVEKKLPAMAALCIAVKGPYEGFEVAGEKLMKHCMEKDMPSAGPMVMVYLKAPPAVKDPKKFVSELCVPMALPPPAKPKKDGEFTLKGTKPMKVLAMFGIGDYKTKTPELMQKLGEEAKKKKAKAAGPMMQVGYTDPKEYPPEQCVSEMQLPIK